MYVKATHEIQLSLNRKCREHAYIRLATSPFFVIFTADRLGKPTQNICLKKKLQDIILGLFKFTVILHSSEVGSNY